jgi:hypothetical protein
LTASAAPVTLAWDASTSSVDGYAIFDRNYQKPYNYAAPLWTGAGLTSSVTKDSSGDFKFFRAIGGLIKKIF